MPDRALSPLPVPGAPSQTSPFGLRLRQWRVHRGWSQTRLAHEAGTTPRHLSFIETGRSRPGIDLVLRLARALDLPIRESNALCEAAGLSPIFPVCDLDDTALRPIRHVVERLLAAHAPYPAWLVGRGYRFIAANASAEALIPGLCGLPPEGVIDLFFGPGPFRDRIDNWAEVACFGLELLRRDAMRSDAADLHALLAQARGLAGDAVASAASVHAQEAPVVCPRFRFGDQLAQTVVVTMRFDTAVELATSELRLELMFPMDDIGERCFRALPTLTP